MPLPQKLLDVVFPSGDAHTLCGIAIGDRSTSLSLPPFWTGVQADGTTRFGWLDIGAEGVAKICCTVADTLGRASRVEVTVEIESEVAEQQVYADLRQLLSLRTGLPGRKEKKSVEWPVTGAHESALRVRLASFGAPDHRIHRIELHLGLAQGVEIKAEATELFIDVRALAEVLATEVWPQGKVQAVLERYFSKDQAFSADAADRDAYRAILDAAKQERPDGLPAMMDRICAITPWTDVDKGRNAVWCMYPLREIGAYSYNVSAVRAPGTGRWLRTNPLDIVCLVHLLRVPLAERGAWAGKVVRALEWGEPEAMSAVREQVKQITVDPWSPLVWDAPDDIEARAFDLVTSGLATDEDRALWPLRVAMYDSSAARACVSYFAARGLRRPRVTVPARAEDSTRCWAEYVMFIKTHFPGLFDDAFAKLFDKKKAYPELRRAISDQVKAKAKAGPKAKAKAGPKAKAGSAPKAKPATKLEAK